MNKRFLTVILSAVILGGFLVNSASAQNGRPPQGIAIIDLSYIFKKHSRFQAELNQMKADVEQREQELRAIRDQIRQKAETLKTFTPGSTNYRQTEAELAQRQADLQVQVKLQKKEFLEREARIYYSTYQEIKNAVRFYCERNNIALVIRFNGDESDGSEPPQVMKELNKTVLFNHPAIDITPYILRQINSANTRTQAGPQRR